MPSSKTALRTRYGKEAPVGATVLEGYFDYTDTSSEDATTTPTGGSFLADNMGVILQSTTDCYVSFNDTNATTNSFKLFSNLIYDFPFAIGQINVLKVDTNGTLKWQLIMGED